MSSSNTRRGFLSSLGWALAALGIGPGARAAPDAGPAQDAPVPRRKLGRTGVEVSCIGLGGYHIGSPADPAEGVRLIRSAIDRGINFLDNCWDYHGGESERRAGLALQDGYRQRAFVMSKIDGHTRAAAARQIDESLKRFRTDHVDLMQFHEVIRPDDPEKIFASGGSWEAMDAARKAGKVRFIGFTGHKSPEIHLHMLEVARAHGVRFDAVQMPINPLDWSFKSFQRLVVPELVKQGIAVLGMKPMADGHALRSGAVTAVECLHYALSMPTSVVITGCERMEILDQAIQAARSFRPLGEAALGDIRKRTAAVAADGRYEPFKVTHQYDGTVQNPQWLG
ncbi:MAG TPA: aldo/keto reductase [Myxococcaceae bacterium]|nr:aldo/keto reductase [Myxococcaceae bacterium]